MKKVRLIGSLQNLFSPAFDEVKVSVRTNNEGQLIAMLMQLVNASFIVGIFPEQLQ